MLGLVASVWEDLSPRYTSMFAGTWHNQSPNNKCRHWTHTDLFLPLGIGLLRLLSFKHLVCYVLAGLRICQLQPPPVSLLLHWCSPDCSPWPSRWRAACVWHLHGSLVVGGVPATSRTIRLLHEVYLLLLRHGCWGVRQPLLRGVLLSKQRQTKIGYK